MDAAANVRASRDGDRYHYYWAAMRALRLLDLNGDLEAVWVEGVPEGERTDGEEVVDIAEYFGGGDATTATKVVYTQIKHSTVRVVEQITASELKKTLGKFAGLYRDAGQREGEAAVTFAFVANRTISPSVRQSIEDLGQEQASFNHSNDTALLRGYMGFEGDLTREAEFCRSLVLLDGEPGVAELETHLIREVRHFLPGGGTGSELAQLVELISRCATSLAATQRVLRSDVLVALRATEAELFPAPSRIEPLERPVRTSDCEMVTEQLAGGGSRRFLLTAVGGMGKSALTSQLEDRLPNGSVVVVYDCFAGGDYRKASALRHDHRTALTQISNELAAKGLCLPLIPAPASSGDYMRVFIDRVSTASDRLAGRHPDALLTIVVDAADNAAIAADELEQRSFVPDLWREDYPSNVRLVVLCRPERRQLLNVPGSGVVEVRLTGFGLGATCDHLRSKFPDAADAQGAELHALSSGNPRVQALAMANAVSVMDALAALQIDGPPPEQPLDALIKAQVDRVADEGHLLDDELLRLGHALATLHPSIPVSDLALITGLSSEAIRSFVAALGRSLHVTENTLQFRDEPTETWFRSAYALDVDEKRVFAGSVQAHADRSPYFANVLPQLLLEADMLDDLVGLALSESGLPGNVDDLEAQEIARSRARFALSATLRSGQYPEAARLAVKTGALTSGRSRKLALFRAHPDLTARFLGREFVENICAQRELATDWPGSNLHVEAVLLSQIEELKDLARSRNRSAFDHVSAIVRAASDDDRARLGARVTSDVVADLALAAGNVDGPEGLLGMVSRWRPSAFVRRITDRACSRFADAGQVAHLEQILTEGVPDHAQVAVVDVMYRYGIAPSGPAAAQFASVLNRTESRFESGGDRDYQAGDISGVVWGVVHGLRRGDIDRAEALRLVELHAPRYVSDHIGSSSSGPPLVPTCLALALRARLDGEPFDLNYVASPKMVEELESKASYSTSRGAREFRGIVGPLLPWVECWLNALLDGHIGEVEDELAQLIASLKPRRDDDHGYTLSHAVAEVAIRLLVMFEDGRHVDAFTRWYEKPGSFVGQSALSVIRLAVRAPHLQVFALAALSRGADAALQYRTDSETRIDMLVGLARTVLADNEPEAKALFELAVQQTERVGDDLYPRWSALLAASNALRTGLEPERAYRLFQIAEALDVSESIFPDGIGDDLLRMHAPTYFAVTSRARDRRTLDFQNLVAAAFEATADSSAPDGRLALHAFAPSVGWTKVVRSLPADHTARVTPILEDFREHENFERVPEPPSVWMRDAAREPDETERLPIDEWAKTLDFTTDSGWESALTAMSYKDDRRVLAATALANHPTNRPDVLAALTRSSHAGMRDYAVLAEAVAEQVLSPAVRSALARFAVSFATRFAREISTRPYDDESIRAVMHTCGIAHEDLQRLAFEELALTAHDLSHADCFRLASVLTESLDTASAALVFDDLAELFDEIASVDTAADGPFASVPSPPADDATCVAGLIWGALGDMSPKVRWQAANAVLLLSKLGCDDVLAALLRFADGTESLEAFVDSRLPFYSLHARMWLLLAVTRAAHEPEPSPMRVFAGWLVSVVRAGGHAPNQLLAQRALVRLTDARVVTLPPGDIDVLTTRVVAETVEVDWRDRRNRPSPVQDMDVGSSTEDDGPWFFIDFGEWCRNLSDVFGCTERYVMRRSGQMATDIAGDSCGASEIDPRRTAGVYGENGGHSDYRSWPGEESHSFYLGVHALWQVGAELAAKHPAYKDPQSPEDAYSEWLARFLPTRSDGRWLAERRDAPPSPTPDSVLAAAAEGDAWPWNMTKSDFERTVGIGETWITVSARVDNARDGLSEDIEVESALVPPTTAEALLVALQTLPQGGFSVPYTGDDRRPDKPPFELVPWLDISRQRYGIDELDERGAGIRFPPPRPSDDVIREFGLTADIDMRRWTDGNGPVFRSRIWKTSYAQSHGNESGTTGETLEVTTEFVKSLLQARDRYLVVQVALRRQRVRPHYERFKEDDDDFPWLDWSRKAYLIDPEGRWYEY